jgi:hypothetical protein
VSGHRDEVLPQVLDEAGQYERADAPPGGTVWDLVRSMAPAAIVMPDRVRETIIGGHAAGQYGGGPPGSSGFPPGWDAEMLVSAVLAVARDPDRITWDAPAASICADISGPPGWRAEGSTGALAITVALREDGEITGAWLAGQPGTAPPPAGARAGHSGRAASRPGPAGPGPLPAIIRHLTAICRARQDRGLAAEVQEPAPGRYLVTISRAQRQLTLAFAWHHRRWDLADAQLTVDGEPQDVGRSLYEVIRMLCDHEIGTGTPSHIRSGSRLPRDTALETKKNTVLRL